MALALAACSPAGAARATPTPGGAALPTASPSPSHLPCASAQPDPAPAAGVSSQYPVLTLASGLSSPDDVLFDGSRVLVGEQASGRIAQVGEGGLTRLPGTIPEVEGIVSAGPGSLYVADQPNDRVVKLAADGTTSTFLQLQQVRGVDGVDNIRAHGNTLLVPDSARGQLLVVGLDGAVQRRVTGFSRPVDAFQLADGTILVADENAAGIWRVAADGSKQLWARGLPLADDVVQDQDGHVFTILINAGTVVQLDAAGNQAVVARGIGQPQGLDLDGAQNLLVTDFNNGLLLAVVTAFKLAPPGPAVALQPNQPLCLKVVRSPGFTGEVAAQPGDGYRVVAPDQVLPQPCGRPECEVAVKVASGALTDVAWLRYRNA